jgi:hypothetical protein
MKRYREVLELTGGTPTWRRQIEYNVELELYRAFSYM